MPCLISASLKVLVGEMGRPVDISLTLRNPEPGVVAKAIYEDVHDTECEARVNGCRCLQISLSYCNREKGPRLNARIPRQAEFKHSEGKTRDVLGGHHSQGCGPDRIHHQITHQKFDPALFFFARVQPPTDEERGNGAEHHPVGKRSGVSGDRKVMSKTRLRSEEPGGW